MKKLVKLTGTFRYTQWDPWLIIFQIAAVQSIMYLSLGLLLVILEGLIGYSTNLHHIFDVQKVHTGNAEGWVVIIVFLINALLGAITLWYLVERTKQCMDFSCTWHLIHLVVCWSYGGYFPLTFSWWALNVVCATLMSVSAEFLCLKTELKAIPLTLGPKTDL